VLPISPATLIAILAAIAVIFYLFNRNTRRREAERAEEYRKAAALRGWQLEFDHVEYRYKGTPYGSNDFEHMDKVVRLGARLAKAYGG
jgi:hypothetical protein